MISKPWFALSVAMAIFVAPKTLAGLMYIESAGRVVGEGEIFTSRNTNTNNTPDRAWRVVPDEDAGASTIFASPRGGKYVQILPDNVGGNAGGTGATGEASILYDMDIQTTGIYELFIKWGPRPGSLASSSDSLFADIVQIKDGAGGAVADWYQLADNGAYPGPNAWDGGGQAEVSSADIVRSAMLFDISTAGVYTLRLSQREDGAAVDAFVFQLQELDTPPIDVEVSRYIPVPGTVALLAAGLLGLRWRRSIQVRESAESSGHMQC